MTLYVGEGSDREQWCLLHSLLVFSHFPRYPQANWALLVLILGWVVCVCSRILWVSLTNSPMRLGVSSSAASIPTGIFSQWFEALCPHPGTLGCTVCPPGPPAAASMTSYSFAHFVSQSTTLPGPPTTALL